MIPSKINALKVNFNIVLDLSLCHFNDTSEKISHNLLNNTKEILIIQLSNDCSLIQQLTILKNLNWTQNYFAIIFSISRDSKTFEHTLLSYIDNQIKSSISILNYSKYSWSFEFPLYRDLNDYNLNQTNIGFIDLNEVKHLNNFLSNQTNFLLYRINRDHIQFDLCFFIFITIIITCMLIGNEWHCRIFMKKILNHYNNHSSKTNKFKYGLIIGLLLLISFILLYSIDRYYTFIIGYVYLFSFMIFSSFIIYLCFENFSYLLINKFYRKFMNKNFKLNYIYQLFRLILMFISFIMIILWFLNRFTSNGFIMTNFIVFFITIVIIVQMRIVNLMICMIIFAFILIFEILSLIIIKFKNQYKRNVMIINPEYPMTIWKVNGNNQNWIDVEFIQHLYMTMFENSGLDCLLSGGSMNILKMNAMKWIIKENLPFVFNFPRLIRNNDNCDFHAGRIYLSIDDIIFPSLLINFCRLFDIGNNIHFRIYYIQVLISYTISFFLSYIVMIITKRDQLSSIMIYPFIVLSTILTGVVRGEFRKLLKGTLTTFEEHQKNERKNSF
ncbi:unnamed protein product [Rotaria sordida]|uniref:Uncharacterized protein n=1 Tax=Rotaria sordida TaxID=392033 RepID=A0A818XAY9_9BILA|nr:unnamed protein product [Rotaria sordida]CAF3737792.1 unnamed protein product [Rotaria sordida]